AASRTLEELDVSIEELQKALEAEVSAWWQQADLLDGQDDCEPAAADADRAVPATAGTRKRTADRLARAEQAREMLAQRHGATCRPWPTTARSSWQCCCTTTRSTSARCTRC